MKPSSNSTSWTRFRRRFRCPSSVVARRNSRRRRPALTTMTAVSFIYARSSQQRRRQYTRGKSKRSILECPLYCNHECRCARLCVCNFFRIQEKNVSLIRALELISLSVSLLCGFVRFFFRRKQSSFLLDSCYKFLHPKHFFVRSSRHQQK